MKYVNDILSGLSISTAAFLKAMKIRVSAQPPPILQPVRVTMFTNTKTRNYKSLYINNNLS